MTAVTPQRSAINPTLARFLEKHKLQTTGARPDADQWDGFIKDLSEYLSDSQSTRNLLEESISSLSAEMGRLNFEKNIEVVREIEKQQIQFQAILNAIPGFVSWFSSDLKYIGVNKQLAGIYGLQVEDFPGQLVGFMDRRTGDSFRDFVKSVFESPETSFSKEMELNFNTDKKYFYLVAQKYRDNTEAVVVGLDVTEHKTAERVIEEQKAKIISSSKLSLLGEMAGGIAHEINNPLTLILGTAELVEQNLRSGQMDRNSLESNIKKIISTVLRISKIITGLRAIARDADSDPFEICNASQIIEESLEFCQQKFKFHRIQVHIKNPYKDVKLLARPAQISQVILNLLNNAYDAIRESSNPWIEVETFKTDSEFQFMVTDSGSGISTDLQERIMQPFFTTKPVGYGTGLGLSVSQGIVKTHGGKLEYDQTCANTRFIVTLPLSAKS